MNAPSAASVPAFVVARAARGGVHRFEVYLEPHRICFIRLGMGPGVEYAFAAQGGLIGWLLSRWISSKNKEKQKQRAAAHGSMTMDQMLTEHKANHAILLSDVSDVSLEPGGLTLKKGSVNWRLQVRGERKRTLCTFCEAKDIRTALALLPPLFPDLRVEVAWDPHSGKYLKRSKPPRNTDV